MLNSRDNFVFFYFFFSAALVAATRTSSVPTRIYHSTILFVAMILYYAYSGSLLSSLTVHKPGLPFTDLDGFFADGSYKMSAANDSFMLYYFQVSSLLFFPVIF